MIIIFIIFKDQLTYRILKRFSIFTGRLSENRREKLARRLATFIYYLLPIRKKQALNNLKNAFPEKDFGWIKKQLKGTYNIVSNNFIDFLSLSRSYSKKRFDPFCRRERIQFEYDENKHIETTVGQLNFFKWAIDNLIIDYIKLHYSEIEEDMNESYNMIKKQKKNSKERKKREELSKSASRGLNYNQVKIILDFD